MIEIILICIGKVRESFYREGVEAYAKRLAPYIKLKVVEIESEPFGKSSQEAAIRNEGNKILKALEAYGDSQVYVLDEKGVEHASVAFAKILNNARGRIVMVIGGSLGLAPQIKGKYHMISLSRLTLPHELARLVLYEQLYRAATIIKGKTYHY